LWYAEDALGWVELPLELAQAVEGFLEIRHKFVMGSGLDDHVVHAGFNIAM
jgi:hypothetical protein